MGSLESSATWDEGQTSSSLSRQYEVTNEHGRHSIVVRKMDNGQEPGVVVRELWVAGEPMPQEFLTDAEFTEAVQAAELPTIDIESIRRSVAATMRLK